MKFMLSDTNFDHMNKFYDFVEYNVREFYIFNDIFNEIMHYKFFIKLEWKYSIKQANDFPYSKILNTVQLST